MRLKLVWEDSIVHILLKLFCKLDLWTPRFESTLCLSSSGTRTTRCPSSLEKEGQTQIEHYHGKHLKWASFMKHEQKTFLKLFLKLFWHNFLDSWTCSDFPNISWFEGNVAYTYSLPCLNAAWNFLCSFWQTDYADFWCTGIIIFYKLIWSFFLFFFVGFRMTQISVRSSHKAIIWLQMTWNEAHQSYGLPLWGFVLDSHWEGAMRMK